ncbi:MAG: element excision factor XisH family protein, partial [Bacteroidota bacterium]
ETVVVALEKDQWSITDDPYHLEIGPTSFQVDLGAEKLIAANKGTEKVAIEIKSFVSPSPTSEFHTALGQYLNYALALKQKESDRTLYLAIPNSAYQEFFQLPFIQLSLQNHQINLLVFDPNSQSLIQWIPSNPTKKS